MRQWLLYTAESQHGPFPLCFTHCRQHTCRCQLRQSTGQIRRSCQLCTADNQPGTSLLQSIPQRAILLRRAGKPNCRDNTPKQLRPGPSSAHITSHACAWTLPMLALLQPSECASKLTWLSQNHAFSWGFSGILRAVV